jgi:hypothetical protein
MARCRLSQSPKIVSFQACAAGVQMINFLSYYTMWDHVTTVRWILKRWVHGSIIQAYQSIYFVQDISRGWLVTALAVFQYNRPISFPTLQRRPETDSVSQKKETSRSYRTFGRNLRSYPEDSFEHEGSLFCSHESATVLSDEMESRPYCCQAFFYLNTYHMKLCQVFVPRIQWVSSTNSEPHCAIFFLLSLPLVLADIIDRS